MPTGTYAPDPDLHVLDANGVVVNGGLVWTYLAGTSSLITTFADVGLSVPNPNPIIADPAGRFVAFLTPGVAYKFIYESAPPTGSPAGTHGPVLFSRDNITAVSASSPTTDVNGIAGVAGGTINAGQAVFLSDGTGGNTAGQWYPTSASSPTSSSLPTTIGVAVNAIPAGTGGLIRLSGTITIPGVTFTVGGRVYLSNASGVVSNTPGTNSRVIGQAQDVTTLIVEPWPPPASVATRAGTVQLTDGALVTLDASLGDVFDLEATADRTISAPTNPKDGQRIIIRHAAIAGNRTLTLASGAGGFKFGSDITALTATASGTADFIGAVYMLGVNSWSIVAVSKGY